MLAEYRDAGLPVAAYALDHYNGSIPQCLQFISTTGIQYPLLRLAAASGVSAAYATGREVCFVIDADGIIRKRMNGFDDRIIGDAIDAALADLLTDVGDAPAARGFTLDRAYPNPFNPSTTISFTLDAARDDAAVTVEIQDVMGRRVARLLDARLPGGREHQVIWDGRTAAGRRAESGTYVALVQVDGERQGRLITLVK